MLAPGRHIVVIGGGAAGLAAAHRLAKTHRVTLIEADARLGGHAWTWYVPDGPDAGLPLDLGFMVLNDRNYPNMHRLLAELGIAVTATEMSFAFHDPARDLSYTVNGPAAAASAGPAYAYLLKRLLQFQRRAVGDIESGAIGGATLRAYLEDVASEVVHDYLLPMGAAIWSTAPDALLEYPARAFLSFFHRHGLLTLDRPPQWQQIGGGSHRYVRAVCAAPNIRIVQGAAQHLRRSPQGVAVRLSNGADVPADYAVVAVQADQALALLEAPTPAERASLSPWRYQTNHAVLHTDETVMPPRAHWASWNARHEGGALLFTYFLNRLQNHHTASASYFLSLSPDAVSIARPLFETRFRHPIFTDEAMAGAAALRAAGVVGRTVFAGSYFGYGFHEDAITSGFAAADALEAAA